MLVNRVKQCLTGQDSFCSHGDFSWNVPAPIRDSPMGRYGKGLRDTPRLVGEAAVLDGYC